MLKLLWRGSKDSVLDLEFLLRSLLGDSSTAVCPSFDFINFYWNCEDEKVLKYNRY